MKTLHRLFLLLVLTLTGAGAASAQKVYEAVDFGVAPLTEITEGQQIAIYFTRAATGFMDSDNLTTLNSMVTESCVFELESAGGEDLYYIKSSATGRYLQMSSSTYQLTTVEAQRSASAFLIVHPDYYTSTSDVPADVDPRRVSVDPNNFEGAGYVINVDAWSDATVAYYLSCYSGYNYVASDYGDGVKYYYYNTFLFYAVREIKGVTYLQEIFSKLLPSGNIDGYIPGTNPGCIPQDVYDELKEAYDTALALLNEVSDDAAACEAAAERLQAAVEAADASVIPVPAGYYIFTNFSADYAALYVDPTDERVRIQTADHSLNFDRELTVDDLPYIWQVIPNDDNTNYLYNPSTGYYMGVAPGYYYTEASLEPTRAYELRRSDAQNGGFFILPSTSDSYALAYRSSWGSELMLWYYGNGQDASAWRILKVSDEDYERLLPDLEQNKRSSLLQSMFVDGVAAFHNGVLHSSDATPTTNYPDPADGLVTLEDQISTNAQHAAYGPLSNVLDGDITTYFQSNFGVEMTDLHYIELDLRDPVPAVELKYTSTGEYYPTEVQIYGSNDQEDWTFQGGYSLTYGSGEEDENTGLLFVPFMGDNYQYMRVVVSGTVNNAKYNGNLYFRLAELRAYEAEVDASIVGEDVTETLSEQLGNAIQRIKENNGTQEDIDALQRALDAFKANVPDPAVLTEQLNAYYELLTTSEEGSEAGQFAPGSKEPFQNVIAQVQQDVDDGKVTTAADIRDAQKRLDDAYAAFQKGVVFPEGVYFIRRFNGQYLYTTSSDPAEGVYSGGYNSTTGSDADIDGRLGYMWSVSKNDDGTYNIRNVGYGHHITYNLEETTGLMFTSDAEAPATTFTVEGAGSGRLYVNAEGRSWRYSTSYNVVTLSANRDAELSPLTFSKVDSWTETFFLDAAEGRPFVLTLPMDIDAIIGGTAYEVKGVTHEGETGTLELSAIADNTRIPGGTPFVLVSEQTGINLLPASSDLAAFDYTFTAANVNGLQGTFQSRWVGAGNGFISNGLFLTGTSDDYVLGNSGVVIRSLVEDTTKGDLSLPVDGTFVTSVSLPQQSTVAPAIYDLQGRRVATPQHGLYIVGGKKVLVK